MKLTHLGHACLQVDAPSSGGDVRIVIDPGVFSSGFPTLADAVVITHSHADHLAPAAVAALAAGGARVVAEAGAAQVLRESGALTPDTAVTVLQPGDVVAVGAVTLEGVGGRHAVIHADIPRIGNVGVLVRDGATTLFHPGDAYEYAPAGVDVLAVPLSAPWAAVKETVEFVRAVAPGLVVPIHDSLLVPAARDMYLGHVGRLGGVQVHDVAAAPLER